MSSSVTAAGSAGQSTIFALEVDTPSMIGRSICWNCFFIAIPYDIVLLYDVTLIIFNPGNDYKTKVLLLHKVKPVGSLVLNKLLTPDQHSQNDIRLETNI